MQFQEINTFKKWIALILTVCFQLISMLISPHTVYTKQYKVRLKILFLHIYSLGINKCLVDILGNGSLTWEKR